MSKYIKHLAVQIAIVSLMFLLLLFITLGQPNACVTGLTCVLSLFTVIYIVKRTEN